MNQYKMMLLKEEFAFLSGLIDGVTPEQINGIEIKKGDADLFSRKGNEDSYDWSGGGHYDYTKYFVVWTNEEDEQILELDSSGRSATGGGDRNDWDADTVGEQLFIKNIAPDYIVECIKNDTDDNGNGEITRYWTIFKMNKFDLKIYHQEQIDKAADELKAEIEAVCTA